MELVCQVFYVSGIAFEEENYISFFMLKSHEFILKVNK